MTAQNARSAALLLALALAASGCGRRGPLEAPGAVAAPAPQVAAGPAIEGQSNPPGRAQVDDSDAAAEGLLASPIPTPPRGNSRRRGYTVPQTPFALDPLL
jgi:predicted small lipoprotein YifL